MLTLKLNASTSTATIADTIAAITASVATATNNREWHLRHPMQRKLHKHRDPQKIAANQAAKKAAENALEEKRQKIAEQAAETNRRRAENDEARLQLMPMLKAAVAAKAWTDPRIFEKAEKAKLWNFTFHSFDAQTLFGDIRRILVDANDKAYDKDYATAVEMFSKLEKRLENMLLNNKPFVVKDSKAKIIIGRQSEMAELLFIKPGEETNMLIEVEHQMATVDCGPDLLMAIGGEDYTDGCKRIRRMRETVSRIFVNNGVDVEFDDGSVVNYDIYAYTASKGKTGSVYAIPRVYTESKPFIEATTLKVPLYGENGIAINGAELMKQRAVFFTPSAPIITANGEHLYLHDIMMFPAIKRLARYAKALVVNERGIRAVYNKEELRNESDGAIFFIDAFDSIESSQMRGTGIKAMAVNVPGMVETIAEIDGKEVPDLRGKKLIATEDIWKMKKLGLSWDEFVKRVEALAKWFPTIGMLRVVRNADSVEETGRKASRQLLQQFIATKNVAPAAQRDEKWLNRFKTLEGALETYAGTRKEAEERSPLEWLFWRVPGLLASEPMKADVEARWNEHLADAASGRVMVDGSYPYIVTDPVAVIRILLFGADPNTEQGLIPEGCINAPGLGDLQKVLINRYPSNFFTAMVMKNISFTDEMLDLRKIYGSIGNVMVLPYNSIVLVLADGDVDGDEMMIIVTVWFIEQFEAAMKFIHQDEIRMTILFEHAKAELKHFATKRELNEEIARSILLANEFGGEVGTNSLLATRAMHKAMCFAWDRIRFNEYLFAAIYAHVGAILAIDLVKTGVYPGWLQCKLAKVKELVGRLPWNELFKRHTAANPWYKVMAEEAKAYAEKREKDAEYQRESKQAIVDKLARYLVDNCASEDGAFHFDTQMYKFDLSLLLNKNFGKQPSKLILPSGVLRKINMRNRLENGSDRAILRTAADGKAVSRSDLLKFFWRNSAALSRKMDRQDTGSSRESDWLQRQAYYAFVREVLIGDEDPRLIANWAMHLAFSEHNGIGKDARNDEEKAALRGQFCRFILQVFAIDVLRNVEENLAVPTEQRFDTLHPQAEEEEPETEPVF